MHEDTIVSVSMSRHLHYIAKYVISLKSPSLLSYYAAISYDRSVKWMGLEFAHSKAYLKVHLSALEKIKIEILEIDPNFITIVYNSCLLYSLLFVVLSLHDVAIYDFRVNKMFVALKEIRLQEEEGAPFTAIREGS